MIKDNLFIGFLTGLVVVGMCLAFGCTKPDEKSPAGLLQGEMNQIFLYRSIIAGCEVPLKLTNKADDPAAQAEVAGFCGQRAGYAAAEATKRELDPSQAYTLQCIRGSFEALGIPKSDVEARKILEFCHDELGKATGN